MGQEILYHHDTEFHGIYECPRTLLASHKSGAGEDMFMGLLLHRLSQKKERRMLIDVIESPASGPGLIWCVQFDCGNLVETYAPDTFKLLFKQRTMSW